MSQPVFVLDPTSSKAASSFRGGGRYISLMKEALGDSVTWVSDLSSVPFESTLIIPFWQPFIKPALTKRIARKQMIVIFDLIPIKWAKHFPIGLHGKANLFWNKRCMKLYDRVITISEHAKSDISELLHVPLSDITVAYLYVSNQMKNKITKPIKLPPSYLLYVGDVNWNKNLKVLAQAVKRQTLPCVFVGKVFEMVKKDRKATIDGLQHPWEREFRQFLTEVGDDDRFIFLGYVPDDQLLTVYKKAEANLLLSRDEGFGLSYLEAARQGCPSVLSDTPVFREIAGVSAFFVPANDPEAIAHGIQELVKKRNEYSTKALTQAKKYTAINFRTSFLSTIAI